MLGHFISCKAKKEVGIPVEITFHISGIQNQVDPFADHICDIPFEAGNPGRWVNRCKTEEVRPFFMIILDTAGNAPLLTSKIKSKERRVGKWCVGQGQFWGLPLCTTKNTETK